ncbi:phosphatidylglycerophosphatase [Geoalkalibacter ferrihydriticus]|uniref:Phosphatidylglycerophosphatase n=2 Tax=Geoalkalibacter ferrihydriticus TaxID=392333 RepID=A0A0C2HTU1_9BACT|nr:phosphatidylglycerophosphatase A [Geoalkalibacter ferrihydriticus]KIH76267.1 phosphatidylglycerophosphatase [Geoalkalibacter ferrihydriticus DSM 17813]SDL23613.1 phosphatidylglycerophosphatase [Geoalkalibacter ferrihydriticus]
MRNEGVNKQKLVLLLSSNAGLGYFPWAPGTIGTLAGIPAFWLLARLSVPLYLLSWTVLLVLAFWAAAEAGRIYGVVDDGRIVIDELVGYLVTVAFVPFSWTTALLGFVFFRFFDIVKLWPASWFDRRMKNGVGVVLDDVVAGIYGAVALHLCLAFLG